MYLFMQVERKMQEIDFININKLFGKSTTITEIITTDNKFHRM